MLWEPLTSLSKNSPCEILPTCPFHSLLPFAHHLYFRTITVLVWLFSILLHLSSFLLIYFCPFSFCSAFPNIQEWTSNLWEQSRKFWIDKARFSIAGWQKRQGYLWTLTCHWIFFPATLWLSKFNVVHGNFYKGRSTTDLLKNHHDPRLLGFRPSHLENTLCAQRPRAVLL